MDVKSNLLLNIPINFHNICTIYPLTVEQFTFNDEDYIASIFLPFVITKEAMTEKFKDYDVFDVVTQVEQYRNMLLTSIAILCKTKKVLLTSDCQDIYINGNSTSINKENFDEFSDIILLSHAREKYKPIIEVIPQFETEEGYNSWLKLKEMREKNNVKQEYKLSDIINLVQVGGKSYISEDLIKTWNLWKLYNTHSSINNISSYESCFNLYLQGGDKKLIEKHWSDLIKV